MKIKIEAERLIIRSYQESDLDGFYDMCSDPDVMRFFPNTMTKEQCRESIEKFERSQEEYGYCFWALELKENGDFVGFTGLNSPKIDTDFVPCVEIGWRLRSKYHGVGLATEAARACLQYGWEHLRLDEIVAYAPAVNLPSIHVMKKIGMHWVKDFELSLLKDYPNLNPCVLYRIDNPA